MTRSQTLLSAAALAAALAAAGAAIAGPGPMGGGFGPGGPGLREIDFAAIDANGDGSLDRTELIARGAARLAAFDLNADGALDRAEIVAAMPSPPAAMFNLFGADPAEAMADRILASEGGVAADRVEVAALSEAQVDRLLARLDEDRDDAISAAEAEAGMERRADRGGPGHHRHGPRF